MESVNDRATVREHKRPDKAIDSARPRDTTALIVGKKTLEFAVYGAEHAQVMGNSRTRLDPIHRAGTPRAMWLDLPKRCVPRTRNWG